MTRIVFLYILSITKIFEQKLDFCQWLASVHQHHAVHGQKPIGCLFVGRNTFSGVCRNCLLSSFLLREEGEECHRWTRITKGTTCIKCAFASTCICVKTARTFCVCVGRLSLTCTVDKRDCFLSKMNQILHCDWLPKQEGWSFLACSGLLSWCIPQEKFPQKP